MIYGYAFQCLQLTGKICDDCNELPFEINMDLLGPSKIKSNDSIKINDIDVNDQFKKGENV